MVLALDTHCRRAGLGSQERVHCIGDGGGWISTVRQGHFPGSRYTLDLYRPKSLRPSDHRHREALTEFQQYVEQNRDGLRYAPGAIWGSGVIEKMVDVIVGKRMKRQGMSWSKPGANNLLALRCCHINSIAA